MKTNIIDLGCASAGTRQTAPNFEQLDADKLVEGSIRYRAADLDQSPDFCKVPDPA